MDVQLIHMGILLTMLVNLFMLPYLGLSASNNEESVIRIGLVKRKLDLFDINREKTLMASSLRNHYNEYMNMNSQHFEGMMSIGTPFRDLNVIFNTGSSHLFLSRHSNSKYKAGYSNTYSKKGFFSKDHVRFGDMVVKNQDFTFLASRFDGIVGLGFQDISIQNSTVPIWKNMVDQGLISKPVYSFWLNQNAGEIVFGGMDSSHYMGTHTYVPVTNQEHNWQFAMNDVLLNGKSTGFCSNGCSATLDSSTSLLAGPRDAIAQINREIGGVQFINLVCKSVVTQYGLTILDMLQQQADPQIVCPQIGLCTSISTNGDESIGIKSVVDDATSGPNVMCTACQMIVVFVQNHIRQNQTEDQILTFIDQLCERLPNSMEEEYELDCNSLSTMPNVSFTIGDREFDLSPHQVNNNICYLSFTV
ncbi:phytepsin-like [Impatiens glandulifera]|uniref:phytepsin-like n=1 Tax=Impatiens glandulifera TaxID=253017 RepID=UPI001FB16301|nr:phytepsin-like [Impatiens glandulifera]